jgi:hypothetical protein
MVEGSDMIDIKWLDRNGFIKARLAQSDTGNGIYYTTTFWALLLANDFIAHSVVVKEDIKVIEKLIDKNKLAPGLYARTPENTYGAQSFDDYIGLLFWAVVNGNTGLARGILWRGLSHAGFFITDKAEWYKGFMWRYPHVFLGLAFCASFPKLTRLNKLILWFWGLFLKASSSASPHATARLDWLWFFTAKQLGYTSPKLKTLERMLYPSLMTEMDADHDCVKLALRLSVLSGGVLA